MRLHRVAQNSIGVIRSRKMIWDSGCHGIPWKSGGFQRIPEDSNGLHMIIQDNIRCYKFPYVDAPMLADDHIVTTRFHGIP